MRRNILIHAVKGLYHGQSQKALKALESEDDNEDSQSDDDDEDMLELVRRGGEFFEMENGKPDFSTVHIDPIESFISTLELNRITLKTQKERQRKQKTSSIWRR